MTTILPEGATVVPVQRTPVQPALPLAPVGPEPRSGAMAWEVLAAVALAHVVPALFVNQFLVYFQLFSMPPALTPFHLNAHRVLVVLGVLCVAVMAACGAARGGWRWSVAAGVVLATSVSLFRVQGAIPGF